MKRFYLNLLFVIIFLLIIVVLGVIRNKKAGNLNINEIMSSNTLVAYDEDSETPDWIEIINNDNKEINISDYYLSDDTANLFMWRLPELKLAPNQTLMVYASGKDRQQVPVFWHSVIDIGQSWKYLVPSSEPSSTWKSINFEDKGWKTGASSLGFGENKHNTEIDSGTKSVFMRKKFKLTNIENLKSLWLHMDYDDGFVAYINGTEVCRSQMGVYGTAVAYNHSAYSHKAKIFNGGLPVAFNISKFIYLLKEKENILAIQVHNSDSTLLDLTAIPILTVGYYRNAHLVAPVSKFVKNFVQHAHTNFKLSSSGEKLSLTFKDGTVVDSISYGVVPANCSFGRDIKNITNWGYFSEPTPGLINKTTFFSNILKSELQFSIPGMFLKSTSPLTISGAAADEEIRYTLNTDEPTQNSKIFTAPILLSKNTVVRARVFKDGSLPGKITTRTYLFDSPPTLPVISLTSDSIHLWDNEKGICVLGNAYENKSPYYGANYWKDWEKPACIEMSGVDGERVFSLNCGIKIFGNKSRSIDQKSFAVFFRNEYGTAVLENVQLFHSKPITSFKALVLRNTANDYNSTRFRDGMMTNLVKDMNIDIPAIEPVVLYLNGQYWGHINLREKINEDFLESYYKVDASKLDLLEYNSRVLEGSNTEYLELIDFLNKNSLIGDANYEIVASQIDIDNFIDYNLSQIYFNNLDWPGNNIKYWKPQTENGKWRWIMYDVDMGFGLGNDDANKFNMLEFALEPNGPYWPNPPWSTLLLRKLVENKSFKNKFINRFADMLNTIFAANLVVNNIDSMAAIIHPEITRHYKRWNTSTEREWEAEVHTMRIFAQNRVQYVQTHINSQFSLNGICEVTVSSVPARAGIIKINTIEVSGDTWKGRYFENVPISLTARAHRGHKFDHWEVNGVTVLDRTIELNLKKVTTVKAIYEDEIDDGNSIVINEINYNSFVENDAGDWVELFNWGRVDIDISGWIFKDKDNSHQFVIPQNTILKTDQYLVLCNNTLNFSAIHPNITNLVGDFDFGLGSIEDATLLYDNTGHLVDSISYSNKLPWPSEPNGTGSTLELIMYSLDNSRAESWKSSLVSHGTPGRANSIATNTGSITNSCSEK